MNLSKSRLRRIRAESRARERLGIDAVVREPADHRVDVERALAALPRRQRQVTVLHYYLELSVKEIATTLQVNEGTVKTSLHRARQALARALGNHDPDEEVSDDARHR